MKLEFKQPKIEFVKFCTQDVITTSGQQKPTEPLDTSNIVNVMDQLI